MWLNGLAYKPIEGAKSTRPFAHCSLDLITDLPPVDGCDSILVVVDQGNTKGAIFIPTTKTLTADGAGQLLLDNLYKQFKLPDQIISDRGPQFAAHSFRELLKLLGIKSNLTTAYHPQSDGGLEQPNGLIKKSKLTCQSIAQHIQPNRKTPYPPSNSPIIIDNMQID